MRIVYNLNISLYTFIMAVEVYLQTKRVIYIMHCQMNAQKDIEYGHKSFITDTVHKLGKSVLHMVKC